MKVQCALCGAELESAHPPTHCFCRAEHRNEWMRQNGDFAAMSRGHAARHERQLNGERDPVRRVSERGDRRDTSHLPSSPEKSSII